jgi:hypothetical protein
MARVPRVHARDPFRSNLSFNGWPDAIISASRIDAGFVIIGISVETSGLERRSTSSHQTMNSAVKRRIG